MEFWRRKIATSALEKCYDNRTAGRSASGGALFVNNNKSKDFLNEDLVSSVVPPVTVVLEGRSICHRISLHKHASYGSLAKALRQMFVDGGNADDAGLDLSNAIPGHLIAYEDMENDLLLVGDLSWKDFVRVARRIRILPKKSNSRKGSIC
ncbi:auxin-responsive protein IAA33 [Ipomoea triloba]|uniref:auxin-responsive protein IAA33 n=1 Tax=Ipomoea triloba TaxID=35885 RepID=UPI00125E567B|nr:auxin-responsive protein IAA33 [Ipomoea triloba]